MMIADILRFIGSHWVEWLFVVLSAGMTFLYKSLKKNVIKTKEEYDNISLGMQALLRNAIVDKYNKYKDKGYCPIYAREVIEKMHKPYRNLGGNGVVEELVHELNEMPTERSDKK